MPSAAGAGTLGSFTPCAWPMRSFVMSLTAGGWTIVVAIDPLFSSVSQPAIMLLVIGGVFYSVGVVFYLWERLAYQQAIWHGFVIAAACCHYAAVFGEIALAGGST